MNNLIKDEKTFEIVTFSNEAEYNLARLRVNENQSATEAWLKENKTNGIPSEVYSKFPYADYVTNEVKSKIEVWEFINTPPEKYTIYVDMKNFRATTFTGSFLGRLSVWQPYKSGFGGSRRRSIVLKGINGIKYHGTFFESAGDYAIIKAYRNQSLTNPK